MPAETGPASLPSEALLRVEVVYAIPQQAWTTQLALPPGATASDAATRSGFAARIPGFDAGVLGYAIFGQAISAATVLRDGDRLELLRPLLADPKQARRRRAERKR